MIVKLWLAIMPIAILVAVGCEEIWAAGAALGIKILIELCRESA